MNLIFSYLSLLYKIYSALKIVQNRNNQNDIKSKLKLEDYLLVHTHKHICNDKGAKWLSGRVLDSRPRGRGFEPHRRHCVVSLSKNINPSGVLVQPRFITERLLMLLKESNQTNKTLVIK